MEHGPPEHPGGQSPTGQGTTIDYRSFFAALPSACALLDRQLVVREVSGRFLELTGRSVDQVLGRPLLSTFPPGSGGAWASTDQHEVAASVLRAFDTGEPDRLPLLRYDIEQVSGSGEFEERWWSITNTPLPSSSGASVLVLNTIDDVTATVRDRDRRRRHREREVELVERTQRLEANLDLRQQQVDQLSAAEERVGRRLQGLALVALELAAADTVEELTDLVVVRGVAAMGCDGGGVAVRDDEAGLVRLTITDTRREGQRLRQEMPLTARLPSVVAAIAPEPIYLGSRAEGLAWGSEMEVVYTTSGCDAWASLPLMAEGRLLGSLTVSWVEARSFSPAERELLSAFAAQCAQALQRIQQRLAEREAMASSRLLSESLQRSLLTEPVQPKDLQLVVRYLPAAREAYVGGDWYDAFSVRGGDTVLVIGDVAGHDRLATAAMAQVRGVLRGVAHSLDGTPAAVLTGLDRAMHDLDVDALATAVLARVHVHGAAPSLRWSNAGHPPPLLLRPDGTSELLRRPPELLLGVQPSTSRTNHDIDLAPGTTVLLYTDGLVERRGETLTRGLEWLRHRVSQLASLSLDSLCDALLAELPSDAEDDVALLAIRSGDVEHAGRAGGERGLVQGQVQGQGAPRPLDDWTATVDPAQHDAPLRMPDVSLALPPDATAVRRARSFVHHHCRMAGMPDSVCDTVALLTSETVTNAFIHGRSEARLRLMVQAETVRVEVGDDNSRHPQRIERQDDALDGRGLDILDLLSMRWGVEDDVAGKIVWFEVARQA